MQTLPILIAEMRMMGVRRLELELEPEAPQTEPAPPLEEAEPVEPKPDGACAFGDCTAAREGILGGIATQFCRLHAFQSAGVKV